jgi:ABC-type sugar transport system ATPase subunit
MRDDWEEARVLVVEPMGNETMITLERRGERMVARVASDLGVEANQPIWIRLPSERTLTFDSEGRRM